MEIIRGIENLEKPFINPVTTLGNFDGIHLGHQRIFQKVFHDARIQKGESVVITFEPHPLKILHPERCPPLLTPFEYKMKWIEKAGIDKVLCIEFTKAFSKIPPHDFIQRILSKQVGAKKIIVGYNYRFGHGKSGDVASLKGYCTPLGIEVEVVNALRVDGTIVSSSKIRELIIQGEVEKASKLLGRNYSVVGRVIKGNQRGRALGFPTANLEITQEVYPKPGVYAVYATWRGQSRNGLANIGFNPTFEGKVLTIEVHLLDFNQSIYGDEMEVFFIKRIRNEVKFASIEELVTQIREDIEWAKIQIFQS